MYFVPSYLFISSSEKTIFTSISIAIVPKNMKEIAHHIDQKTGSGYVKLEASDAEDMWHVYNLINEGDKLRAPTIRKVQQESVTGSSSSDRVHMTITIQVKSFEYDPSVVMMRVTGRVATENKHVRVGAFHTLELEPHRAFSIEKESWDSIHLERLKISLDPATDADLGAIVMEEGLAHVLMVSRSLTLTRSRIQMAIPRKGKNALYNRDSALTKFFREVLRVCVQHLDLSKLKVLLIASPGFVKDEFYKYVMLEASRQDLRDIIDNKSKIILCHASSGHKHALHEVLTRPELQSRLSDTKAVGEVHILNDFNDMLKNEPDRAVYGPAHVKFASEMGAIQNLLVTDKLFRASDVEMRKKYVQLVENVRGVGAQVNVFSTQHVTGEQLDLMSGVAAILRFPLAGLDEIDPSDGF